MFQGTNSLENECSWYRFILHTLLLLLGLGLVLGLWLRLRLGFTVVSGFFAPRYFRSLAKVPSGNLRSQEQKFPGTFAPGNFCSRELLFPGVNVPGNFSS